MSEKHWFTSDHHFNHRNIIRYCNRPWVSVDTMNQGLVDRWNAVVQPNDVVHVLGDVCWGSVGLSLPWLEQLQGRVIVTPGNHDTFWSGHKKRTGQNLLVQRLGWIIKPEQNYFHLGGTERVNVCHFPYTEDGRHGEMYAEHRPLDDGKWLLHGHVHDSWKVKDRQINVGVDVWDWAPVPEEELIAIVSGSSSLTGE